MSDFFGDDFTAELKGYYLTSLNDELVKFIDLVDDSTLKRVRAEIREQCQSWIVDAKSNEFEYLSAWFQGFLEKLDIFVSPNDLIQALRVAKKYVDNLQETKKDSPEYATQFALTAELQGESLYLHCKVAEQEFVVPIKYVVEISGTLPLYPLPEKRQGLLGVIPFRGDAIPVFSLQDFGFQKNQITQFFYVICEFGGTRFSLQVTGTDDLMSVSDRDLQSVGSHSGAAGVSSVFISVPFIRYFFVKDQRGVMVLDIERLVAA